MYALSRFRTCVEELQEGHRYELPLVMIPPLLRPKFMALDSVPLYHFDFAQRIDSRGRHHERVVALTAEQLVICACEGSVRRCIELNDVVDVMVDQNCQVKKKLRYLRMTRLYIRTREGYNLYIRVVRKASIFMHALHSLTRAELKLSTSESAFDSSIDLKSLQCPMKEKPRKFRVPATNFVTHPEMRDLQVDLERIASHTPRHSAVPEQTASSASSMRSCIRALHSPGGSFRSDARDSIVSQAKVAFRDPCPPTDPSSFAALPRQASPAPREGTEAPTVLPEEVTPGLEERVFSGCSELQTTIPASLPPSDPCSNLTGSWLNSAGPTPAYSALGSSLVADDSLEVFSAFELSVRSGTGTQSTTVPRTEHRPQ
eukprot:TRINITY_DN32866_c0_g1_i1.p1 TRINITY_DN32866_c0_g1~~TRINITY_DN32866_c0_g1_i1.p1  ORF type:complete len:373 (+),score=21.79 TRINITY_DN32866_c0_g1_i1:179-1297(+)